MRSGNFVQNHSGELAYRSFAPSPLPPNPPIEVAGELLRKLVSANKGLAQVSALAENIPDLDLFLSMYIRKEALLSAQIEGTQCTLDDIFDPDLSQVCSKDVQDVINYIKATNFAIEKLQELPLCNRLIRETHAVLTGGVRGGEKTPGEFRRSQNWIGSLGCSLANARYVPPNPTDMQKAMADLEIYINGTDDLDPLIQAALVHYQFETIHPFLDGNGRVGRLLIMLFLLQKKVLKVPCIYISYFLKKNRIDYYDRMMAVRQNGNYEQWITFFLAALEDSAQDAKNTLLRLIELRKKSRERIMQSFSSRTGKALVQLLTYLEKHPMITIKTTALSLDATIPTATKYVSQLVDLGILTKTSNKRRNRVFCYEKYLEILRRDSEPALLP